MSERQPVPQVSRLNTKNIKKPAKTARKFFVILFYFSFVLLSVLIFAVAGREKQSTSK
jgi:cell division septal protein FtsQ